MVKTVNIDLTVFKEDNIDLLEKELNIKISDGTMYIPEFSDRIANISTNQMLKIIFPTYNKEQRNQVKADFNLINNASRKRTILESNTLLLLNVSNQNEEDVILIDPLRFLKEDERKQMTNFIDIVESKKNIYVLINREKSTAINSIDNETKTTDVNSTLNTDNQKNSDSSSNAENENKINAKPGLFSKVKTLITLKTITLKRNWIKLLFIVILGATGATFLSTATVLDGHEKPAKPRDAIREKIKETINPETMNKLIQEQLIKEFNNSTFTPAIGEEKFNVKVLPGEGNKIITPESVENPRLIGGTLLEYFTENIKNAGIVEDTKENIRDNIVYSFGGVASDIIQKGSLTVMIPFYFVAIIGLMGYLSKKRKYLSNIITRRQYRKSIVVTGVVYVAFVFIAMLIGGILFSSVIQSNLGLFKGRFDFHRFFISTNFYYVVAAQIIITLYFYFRKENKNEIVRSSF
jgi:hypothetical protein